MTVRAQQHEWMWASDSGLQTTRSQPDWLHLLSMTPTTPPPGTAERLPDQRLLTCSNKRAKWAGAEPGWRGLELFSVNQESRGGGREGRGGEGGSGCSRALTDNFPPSFDPPAAFHNQGLRISFPQNRGCVTGNEKRQLLFRIQIAVLGVRSGSEYWGV